MFWRTLKIMHVQYTHLKKKKKKKVAHSTYNVTQRVYIILYIQSTPFIKEGWKYCTSYEYKFSKKFTNSTNTKSYSQINYFFFF